MTDYLKKCLQGSVGFFTALFVTIWLIAWTLNAFKYAAFDLNALKDLYGWVISQLNIKHAVDSVYNSPRETHPDGG